MERRHIFFNANAVHLLVRGFPRVSSAPSGSTKPWRIPQSCATRSQQIAYLGESNCGWRNPWDETRTLDVFLSKSSSLFFGKVSVKMCWWFQKSCNSDTNMFDKDFNDCFWMLRDSNTKSDKELMKFSLCIATHVVSKIPSLKHRWTAAGASIYLRKS